MRYLLICLFSSILGAMIFVTSVASADRGLFEAGADLIQDYWFVATLCDAYFGFLTFYVWVAYKEITLTRRLLWFLLIMLLGNIAMAIYMLIQLARLPRDASVSDLLLSRAR